MSSSKTSNYQLNQWVKSDRVLMEDFNADNAKIDAGIKAVDQRVDSLQTTVNGKASQSSLNSLTTTVNGKASQSSLNSLTTTVNGLKSSKADKSALNSLEATVTQHTAALAKTGNCLLYYTTYTGSGTFGMDKPNSLSFPHKPLAVFISVGSTTMALFQGTTTAWADNRGGGEYGGPVSWSGNRVEWYTQTALGQMNNQGWTYVVVALLDAEN